MLNGRKYTRTGPVQTWRDGSRALLTILTAWVALLAAPGPLAFAEDKVFGHQQQGKALVYLIRQSGKNRHVFANEQWLGAVPQDAYTFSYLDPGEYLLWNDRIDYQLVFLSSGKTYYFELERKRINELDETEGLRALQTVSTYTIPNVESRRQGMKKLGRFQRVQQRASFEGAYEPCLFAEAKQEEYARRAKAGDTEAQHDIATQYWSGECIDQDRKAGLHWYEQAAQSGHGLSALLLGNIYAKGISVTADSAAAARWYRIAAEQKDRSYQSLYALRWLEQNDADYRTAKRLRLEAAARVEIEEEKQREERQERRQIKRKNKIESTFDQLGIAVTASAGKIRLESPRRKKPQAKEVTNRGDSELTYMLPPEIALGVLAVGWVVGAIETAMKSQLSGTDKKQIKDATDQLALAFADRAISRELRQKIVDSGQLPSGNNLFSTVEYQPPDLGPERYRYLSEEITAVVEIETTGVGIVLAEKRYRPARFVVANKMRVIQRADGTVLKEAPLCYASRDTHNFSDWASDNGKRLKYEVETAYARIAQDVLMILAEDKNSAGTTEAITLCARLEETVDQLRQGAGESGRR